MSGPREPTGDVGLPITRLSAEAWVTSLLLIRTAVATSFVNKFGGHTLEILTRPSKHRKPAHIEATWVNDSHLRVALSHRVVDSIVADMLKCCFLVGGPSHFHLDCRLNGAESEVTLTFEFPN